MNNPSQFQPNAGTSKPSFLDSANVPMTPKTEPDPVQSEWVPEDSLSGVVGDVERFCERLDRKDSAAHSPRFTVG